VAAAVRRSPRSIPPPAPTPPRSSSASGFSLGAVNVAYVTVTVCSPGSTSACATIDHVLLDTGSIGLRVLKSMVAPLSLPAVTLPASGAASAGTAVECYPFVLGAVWGPLARADVRIAGELAPSLPVQLIDDATPASFAAPADCVAASDGVLQNTAERLQANGILGIGMVAFDCGLACITGDYSGGYTLYYSCPAAATGVACTPAAVPADQQALNPVAHFAVNNNGTVVTLPSLPDLGAGVARGRLVFGIGTQSNNQISPAAKMYFVETDPANPNYLYFSTQSGTASYPQSYIDSGSNALFFDDAALSKGCQSSGGSSGAWYCPASPLHRTATLSDAHGSSGTVDFTIASADVLFATSSLAFADLAGSAGPASASFAWGLPFFFGRTVYTSIWGQALASAGPWNAF
jgi:hypothetical protein